MKGLFLFNFFQLLNFHLVLKLPFLFLLLNFLSLSLNLLLPILTFFLKFSFPEFLVFKPLFLEPFFIDFLFLFQILLKFFLLLLYLLYLLDLILSKSWNLQLSNTSADIRWIHHMWSLEDTLVPFKFLELYNFRLLQLLNRLKFGLAGLEVVIWTFPMMFAFSFRNGLDISFFLSNPNDLIFNIPSNFLDDLKGHFFDQLLMLILCTFHPSIEENK